MSRSIISVLFGFVVTMCFQLPKSGAQTLSSFPVDITSGPAPQAFSVNGRLRLVYELHITNFAPWSIELEKISVTNERSEALVTFGPDDLKKMVAPASKVLISLSNTSDSVCRIGAGCTAWTFIELNLDSGATSPFLLQHRFTFSTKKDKGEKNMKFFRGPDVTVNRKPVPVIKAPVKGTNWIAFNAFGGEGHRRAVNPVNGRMYIAERYAVDWMCLGTDSCLLHGDGNKNSNFYSDDAALYAVADGRVVALVDSFPDIEGRSDRGNRNITLDNIIGNYITLDLGEGRFALYGHLKHKSLKIKPGEIVKAGQMIARLGNSGNSDEPHLHFQMTDANSPLGAEGIPYVFESFTQRGIIEDEELLEKGARWQQSGKIKMQKQVKAFPYNKAVVNFSD